jgi:hypothetical protein
VKQLQDAKKQNFSQMDIHFIFKILCYEKGCKKAGGELQFFIACITCFLIFEILNVPEIN